MNFHFDCNIICMVYLLTCRICKKQYTGSTITRFWDRFNQYKSNLKFYGEGRRDFKKKLLEHFYNHDHHGTHNDIIVQIIYFCDPNDQEKRENFWLHKLRTLYPDGLNHKKINQWTFNIFVQLLINFIYCNKLFHNFNDLWNFKHRK